MERMRWLRQGVWCALVLLLVLGAPAQAFLFEITPLNTEAIVKLNDTQLVDAFIDVMIELEAVGTFYNNAGFTPRDYAKYKALLRFRTDLILEMRRRAIEIPQIK